MKPFKTCIPSTCDYCRHLPDPEDLDGPRVGFEIVFVGAQRTAVRRELVLAGLFGVRAPGEKSRLRMPGLEPDCSGRPSGVDSLGRPHTAPALSKMPKPTKENREVA